MGRFSEDIIRLFELFKEETGKYRDLDLGKVEFREIYIFKEIENKLISVSALNLKHDIVKEFEENYRQNNPDLELYPVYSASANPIGYLPEEYAPSKLVVSNKENPDISFATDGNASAGTNFIIHYGKYYINNTRKVIKFSEGEKHYYTKYLYFALQDMKKTYNFNRDHKATSENLKQVKIPIPKPLGNYTSYDIQKAIADFIEFVTLKSEEVQKLMDEIIRKTELLRKTLLVKLFTKLPYKRRNGKKDLADLFKLFDRVFKKEFKQYKTLNFKKVEFEEEKLKDVAKEIISGFAYGRFADEGIPHLRPNNIDEDGNLNFSKVKYIPHDEKKKRELYLLKAGDILFNNTNSIDLVGKTCYINSDIEAVFSNHITRIRVKEDYNPKYLAFHIQSLFISGYFKNIATKWINQAGINTERLKEIKIPIPKPLGNYTSYDIQKAIADFVEFINRKLDFCKEFAEEYKLKSNKLNKLLLRKIFG